MNRKEQELRNIIVGLYPVRAFDSWREFSLVREDREERIPGVPIVGKPASLGS